MLVEVWSTCIGAALVNAAAGRRLAATQKSGNVQLDIVTYERVRSLAAALASVAAFQTDLKRCAAAELAVSRQSLLVIALGQYSHFPHPHPQLGSGKFAAAVVAGIPSPPAKAMFKPRVPANSKSSW